MVVVPTGTMPLIMAVTMEVVITTLVAVPVALGELDTVDVIE
jgi:hypothetical protein